MNTAIKNAKKTLAVLLCVLMFSAFAVPFAGAVGAINWEVNEDGYTVTVPKDADGVSVVTLQEAKAKLPDGTEGVIEYSLVLVNGTQETAAPAELFGFSADKPEISVKNMAKTFVANNDIDKDGVITLGMRAVCGTLQSDICLIRVENYKVKATFSYLNNKDEYVDVQTEVYYGQSAKEFSKTIKNFSQHKNDEYCHYINNGWVDFFGESKIDRVIKDTTFVLSFSSEAHYLDPNITGYVKKEPTCTEDGYTKGYCGYCAKQENGYTELIQVDFPALGHDEVIDEAGVPATCTENGKTEGWHCSRCDYKVESTVIPSNGHVPVTDPATEATCTEPAKTEGSHCAVCGEVFVAQESEGEALGHDKVQHEAKEPTCTEVGWDAYETCSRCDYSTYAEKAKLGHLIDEKNEASKIEGREPTCTSAGHTEGYKCLREGCTYTTSVLLDVIPHTKSKIKEAVDATCSSTGLTEGYTCSVCGLVVEQEVIDMLDHTEVVDAAVAATCTEKGKTQGKHCSVCNTVIEPQKETDALGHDMVVTKEGYEETCTEKGFTDEKKCSRCDVVEGQTEIPPKGHSLVTEYGRDATCTEDGESDCVFCTVCGHVEKEREVIKNFGGHKDLDNDGFCDRCGTEVEKPQSGNTCGCICHKGGIVGWLWKSILCPIIKFLGIEQKCKCGVDHWTK